MFKNVHLFYCLLYPVSAERSPAAYNYFADVTLFYLLIFKRSDLIEVSKLASSCRITTNGLGITIFEKSYVRNVTFWENLSKQVSKFGNSAKEPQEI